MSQARPLIDTLKQELSKQCITCNRFRERSTFPKPPSNACFPGKPSLIRRPEKICRLLHLEIDGLVRQMAIRTWLVGVLGDLRRVKDTRVRGSHSVRIS